MNSEYNEIREENEKEHLMICVVSVANQYSLIKQREGVISLSAEVTQCCVVFI